MNRISRISRWTIAVTAASGLIGCGSGNDVIDPVASRDPLTTDSSLSYSVGGTLSGLVSGASLTLRNADGGSLVLNANGAFTFAAKLADAAAYAVSVDVQPTGQTCTVSNANGHIHAANVTNVGVVCVPAATLLFKTNFGPGVKLSGPQGVYTGGAWQSFSGTDAETGFSFPIAALGSDRTGLQLIGPYLSTGTAITIDNVNNYFGNVIQSVTGPAGSAANELFFNLKIKEEPPGSALTQVPLMINRPWTIGDLTDLYITYWFKHPIDLPARMSEVSSGNWRTQFEFKTGGYDGTWKGDYRIGTSIFKSRTDGSLYWYTKGDNVANGPWDRVDYWSVENHTVPVPLDKWFKFEVFWHRSNGSDGRYWAAVDGQVIADHFGPNMGNYNLPITRLMPHVAYTGGTGPVQGHMVGLEIWNTFPCGVGKSCYAPAAH